jgi:high affinity Mn2+ porin
VFYKKIAQSRFLRNHFRDQSPRKPGGDPYYVQPKDQVGTGGALNAISHAHANYLAAGGLGFILGDGALSYEGERVLETYYKYADGIHVSLDYQFVDNPGYNLARGPVSLFALRLHAEF